MEFTGIVFFQKNCKTFQYVEKSNDKIGRILDLDWNNELRLKSVKVSFSEDQNPSVGKLFARIKGKSSKRFIKNLIDSLNDDLKTLAAKCTGDALRGYESMVILHDFDKEDSSPEESVDYDLDMEFGKEEDNSLLHDSAFDSPTLETKIKRGRGRPRKISKVTLNPINEGKNFENTFDAQNDGILHDSKSFIDDDPLTNQPPNEMTKEYLENFAIKLRKEIREDTMKMLDKIDDKLDRILAGKNQNGGSNRKSSSTEEAKTPVKSLLWYNILPFDSDEEIEEFFENEENVQALYHHTKSYFSKYDKLTKGLKAILSLKYICSHNWDPLPYPSEKLTNSGISRILKHWLETTFFLPMAERMDEEERPKIKAKASRFFANTRAKQIAKKQKLKVCKVEDEAEAPVDGNFGDFNAVK